MLTAGEQRAQYTDGVIICVTLPLHRTWKLNKDETHTSVASALKTGFRHIDSAWAYKSECLTLQQHALAALHHTPVC